MRRVGTRTVGNTPRLSQGSYEGKWKGYIRAGLGERKDYRDKGGKDGLLRTGEKGGRPKDTTKRKKSRKKKRCGTSI